MQFFNVSSVSHDVHNGFQLFWTGTALDFFLKHKCSDISNALYGTAPVHLLSMKCLVFIFIHWGTFMQENPYGVKVD